MRWRTFEKYFIYFFPVLTSLFSFITFITFTKTIYLTFSDAAKFADVARHLVTDGTYTSSFSNFISQAVGIENIISVSKWIPPVMPMVVAGFFKTFGVSDLSIILTSSFFFVFSTLVIFLIGKKLFGKVAGFLIVVAFSFNINILEYAASGASESIFIFEILLASYLFVLKKKWSNILGFTLLVLMYFTKAQAIIYIFALILLFLLVNYSFKKAVFYFSLLFVFGSATFIMTSSQGIFAITQHLPGIASSTSLRGGVQQAGFVGLYKKVFYNLYNFYRLMPQIINPYLFALFIVSLFKWGKDRLINSLKISTIFMVVLTFLVTAATIPFFRYIHPVVPMVYLFAVDTLVWIVGMVFNNFKSYNLKILSLKFKVDKKNMTNLTSTVLVFVFAVGQTLGVIFLDSRYERRKYNFDKPPVYTLLSWKLKEKTDEDDVVLTNLDTWGSWYGERKTVWFPLEPKQLVDTNTNEIPFDAIYLTSYLIDDENYYMGDSWRQIFFNPDNPEKWTCEGCEKIKNEYILKDTYDVSASDSYQNLDAYGVLLVKKASDETKSN